MLTLKRQLRPAVKEAVDAQERLVFKDVLLNLRGS
jgi:hypothetical protein